MHLKGRDAPADRPRNELEEGGGYGGDEKWKNTWGNIGHVDSSATGSLLKQFLQDQLFFISEERLAEVLEASWGSRTTVVYSSPPLIRPPSPKAPSIQYIYMRIRCALTVGPQAQAPPLQRPPAS